MGPRDGTWSNVANAILEARADVRLALLAAGTGNDFVKSIGAPARDLDALIESPQAVNGTLSLDDIRVLPLLRSVAVVKGLSFPRRVRDYFETMMSRIGFKPLPAA